ARVVSAATAAAAQVRAMDGMYTSWIPSPVRRARAGPAAMVPKSRARPPAQHRAASNTSLRRKLLARGRAFLPGRDRAGAARARSTSMAKKAKTKAAKKTGRKMGKKAAGGRKAGKKTARKAGRRGGASVGPYDVNTGRGSTPAEI